MNKTKALIALLLHIALGVAIIVVIMPMLQSNSDGYSGAVPVVPAVEVVETVEVVEVAEVTEVTEVTEVETAATPTEESIDDTVKENEDNALYSVVDGNKLDANSYAGFKLYRNWCSRCHGTYGQGMVGPNLADSLKVISEKEFFNTVENGKSGTIGSMPAWKANVKVMAGRDQLYAYLMARSDGAIGVEKPKKQ